MKRKRKWEMGGFRGIGFHVDEEVDSKYTCCRKCFVRAVLLIRISKVQQYLRFSGRVMHVATILKLVFKTPVIYIHNFNRDIPEELVRKQFC